MTFLINILRKNGDIKNRVDLAKQNLILNPDDLETFLPPKTMHGDHVRPQWLHFRKTMREKRKKYQKMTRELGCVRDAWCGGHELHKFLVICKNLLRTPVFPCWQSFFQCIMASDGHRKSRCITRWKWDGVGLPLTDTGWCGLFAKNHSRILLMYRCSNVVVQASHFHSCDFLARDRRKQRANIHKSQSNCECMFHVFQDHMSTMFWKIFCSKIGTANLGWIWSQIRLGWAKFPKSWATSANAHAECHLLPLECRGKKTCDRSRRNVKLIQIVFSGCLVCQASIQHFGFFLLALCCGMLWLSSANHIGASIRFEVGHESPVHCSETPLHLSALAATDLFTGPVLIDFADEKPQI